MILSFRQTIPPPWGLPAYPTALMTRPLLRLKREVFGLALHQCLSIWFSILHQIHKVSSTESEKRECGTGTFRMSCGASITPLTPLTRSCDPGIVAAPGPSSQGPQFSTSELTLAWAETHHNTKCCPKQWYSRLIYIMYIYVCIYVYWF